MYNQYIKRVIKSSEYWNRDFCEAIEEASALGRRGFALLNLDIFDEEEQLEILRWEQDLQLTPSHILYPHYYTTY